MNPALKLSLFLLVLFTFGDRSFALSDYQIKEICKKEKKQSNCIKYLREKRSNLQKGAVIEIPVMSYK